MPVNPLAVAKAAVPLLALQKRLVDPLDTTCGLVALVEDIGENFAEYLPYLSEFPTDLIGLVDDSADVIASEVATLLDLGDLESVVTNLPFYPTRLSSVLANAAAACETVTSSATSPTVSSAVPVLTSSANAAPTAGGDPDANPCYIVALVNDVKANLDAYLPYEAQIPSALLNLALAAETYTDDSYTTL
ncbi:hypothetical protein BABINDRAFT_146054, partial [Babjeviella inositovora NRRL Y-12698]